MNNIPKVSIIIPIYNTEQFLKKCLDSIISQTLTDIEIICVNDGSPDNSQIILEEYASKDKRIKIINKSNGGLVSARKAGIVVASSEYIGFVDSDDWIEPEMFEKLYEHILNNDVDLVSSGYIMEGNYISKNVDSFEIGKYDVNKIEYIRNNSFFDMENRIIGLRGSLCCKLFRRDILEKSISIIPDNISIAEDRLTLTSFLLECKSVYITHEAYYHYIIYPQSMSHKSNTDYLIKVNDIFECLTKLYVHPNFTASMKLQVELYITDLLVIGVNNRLGFENSNLLWTDPSYLEKIPSNSKIAVYGGGAMGRKYYKQLLNAGFYIPICVDYEFEKMNNDILNLKSPQELLNMEFDYVLITIKNKQKASEIKTQLIGSGVPESKVLWFEQKELFWKYAEADGLI